MPELKDLCTIPFFDRATEVVQYKQRGLSIMNHLTAAPAAATCQSSWASDPELQIQFFFIITSSAQ